MRIGVISDTHSFFDPKVSILFRGVDHILHGGDIGSGKIIHELEAIAPVTAVMGNTDDPGFGYRQTEVVELGGRKFLLHHIVNPHGVSDAIHARINRERPDVVIFGHTHKPFCETLNGTLYFNPGYAGKTRFGLQRTVALLFDKVGSLHPEFLPL